MADSNTIAKELADFYYANFSKDRSLLAKIYRPESLLIWEGEQCKGLVEIERKLGQVGNIRHKVTTYDALGPAPGVQNTLVFVTGLLQLDDNSNALQFSQTFLIGYDGGYYVQLEIFRLNYS